MKWCAICLAVWASPVMALELTLPGGSLDVQAESPAATVRLPRAAWEDGTVFKGTDGAIRRSVYSIADPNLTTLQLISPIRDALEDAGYSEVFSCADAGCGGFDFRFQLDLLPAPDMFVDLGNYRYLLMEAATGEPRLVSLLASSSSSRGYVHVTELGEAADFDPVTPADTAPEPVADTELVAELVATGHVVLGDLDFATGSADLGPGQFRSLQVLAEWLNREPSARVVLVGHTDSVGSLEANAALSRRRAESVLERLAVEWEANRTQMQADGAGALSPVASNLTEDGRAANRRVEVVLLSLE